MENIKLFLAKNQYSEIENVAKQITRLVRDKKLRYKDETIEPTTRHHHQEVFDDVEDVEEGEVGTLPASDNNAKEKLKDLANIQEENSEGFGSKLWNRLTQLF